MRVLAILVALVFARGAQADPIFMSGFDGATNDTTSTTVDSYEFNEHLVGASPSDTWVQIVTTTNRMHNAASGGSDSSHHALYSSPPAGKSGYYTFIATMGPSPCANDDDCCPGLTCTGACVSATYCANRFDFNPKLQQLTVAISVNVDAPPATNNERTILAFTETGAATPGTPGCNVALKNVAGVSQLALYYSDDVRGGKLSWGTTAVSGGILPKYGCTATPNYQCVTAGNDCPTAADTCGSGANGPFYWGGIELTQVNRGTDVLCELWVDGNPVYTGTYKTFTGTVGSIANLAVGVSDFGESPLDNDTATVYMDDLVVDDSGARAGYGYVALKMPYAAGKEARWKSHTPCYDNGTTENGSPLLAHCVDDYLDTTNTYALTADKTEDSIQVSLESRQQDFYQTQVGGGVTDLALRSGESATAVEAVTIGRTSNGNNVRRAFTSGLLVCPSGACVAGGAGTCVANVCTTSGASCAANGDADCAECTNPGAEHISCATSAAVDDKKCCVSADLQKACDGLPGKYCTADCQCTGTQPCSGPTWGGTVCQPYVIITDGTQPAPTDPQLFTRFMQTSTPVPGEQKWSGHLGDLGVTFLAGPYAVQQEQIRVAAAMLYVRVQKPDALNREGRTLKDHNAKGYPCVADADCCPGTTCAAACNTGTHQCQNTTDNQVTVALFGDSTLQGTLETNCVGGTAPKNTKCAQNSYCSWDDTLRDKPSTPTGCGVFTGGVCGSGSPNSCDLVCRTCKGDSRRDFASGAGVLCTTYADCNLGTCNGSNVCTGNDDVVCATDNDCKLGISNTSTKSGYCSVNGDCQGGVCNVASHICQDACSAQDAAPPTCVESCPGGGACPTARQGWGGNMATSITADTVLICGKASETTIEAVTQRVLPTGSTRGILNGAVDGTTLCSIFPPASGQCTCTSGSDCNAGTCGTSGLCTSGGGAAAKCRKGADCKTLAGATAGVCQARPPDYIVGIEGYNNGAPATDDPQCKHFLNGFLGYAPWCPALTGAASYACPSGGTTCTLSADCPGSPNGECVGRIISDTSLRCMYSFGVYTCTLRSGYCDPSVSCNLVPGATNLVCDGSTGVPGTLSGICHCDGGSTCGSGYTCVGPTGGKFCRRTCTVDGDCGSGATCVCPAGSTCPTDPKICTAKCNCPAQAIGCTKDADCGAYDATGHSAGTKQFKYRGLCNKVSGKCWSTGDAGCTEGWSGPCSCSADGDCPGSTCDATTKVCVGGARADCARDADCAKTQRCLSPKMTSRLLVARGTQRINVEAFRKLQASVTDLGLGVNAPVVIAAGLPAANGLLDTGQVLPDGACFNTAAALQRLQIEELQADPTFATQHVVDFRGTLFDTGRFTNRYHTDTLHYASRGASAVGQIVVDHLNQLNVCVKRQVGGTLKACSCATNADCGLGGVCNATSTDEKQNTCTAGTTSRVTCTAHRDCSPGNLCGPPQRYCRNNAGSYTGTLCVMSTDCGGVGSCVRRPCNGSGANCTGTSDVCGSD